MKRKFPSQVILIAILFLCACTSAQPVINELSNTTSTYDETIHINNCGNKAESTQTASRSFSTKISGTGTVKAGYDKIVEGSVSATYEQFKNTTKTQILTAAPQTNMEFLLKWSDNVRAGNVTVNKEITEYTVNIPVSVEQVSSRDLGCSETTNPPTEIPSNATAQTPTLLESIKIPSSSNAGLVYYAPQSGKYIFQYNASDSAFWNGINWATQTLAFQGAAPEWANSYAINYETALFVMGDIGYATKQSATDDVRNQRRIIELNTGEFITLVVADEKNSYSDNTGEITLDVFFLP